MEVLLRWRTQLIRHTQHAYAAGTHSSACIATSYFCVRVAILFKGAKVFKVLGIMGSIQTELKRKAKEAEINAKKLKATPAQDVNDAPYLLPWTMNSPLTNGNGKTGKWYPLQAVNLLGLQGGRCQKALNVPYNTYPCPRGKDYCMVLLNHRQSWLSTLCGGTLKRCTVCFDLMRKAYRLQQKTEAQNAALGAVTPLALATASAEDPVVALFSGPTRPKRPHSSGIVFRIYQTDATPKIYQADAIRTS